MTLELLSKMDVASLHEGRDPGRAPSCLLVSRASAFSYGQENLQMLQDLLNELKDSKYIF